MTLFARTSVLRATLSLLLIAGLAHALASYPEAVVGQAGVGRHEGAPRPAFFRHESVAVENDSIVDFYLTSTPGAEAGAHMKGFPDTASAMSALRIREVMAVMGPVSQLMAASGEGVAVHALPLPGYLSGRWTLGLALHHSHRDLACAVDDAVAASLKDGRIAADYARYGLIYTPRER